MKPHPRRAKREHVILDGLLGRKQHKANFRTPVTALIKGATHVLRLAMLYTHLRYISTFNGIFLY